MTATIDTSSRDVSLLRLINVELRKSVDTLAGRWMLLIIAIFTILVNLGIVLGANAIHAGPVELSTLLYWQNKFSFLVPVLAILLATSEWSQRTAMVTFTLAPNRWMTLVAKTVVALILGTAAFGLSLTIGGLMTLAGGHWNLSGVELFQRYISQLIGLSQGLALGFAFLSSAAAIVTYFGIRIVWVPLTGLFVYLAVKYDAMNTIRPWIDLNLASALLYHSKEWLSAKQWGQIATSTGLWVGIPLAIGVWRVLRSEVK